MNSVPSLKIAFCSHEAATYAVLNWHYSKTMPRGKLVKVGVWEQDKFIGCVLFGRGASNNLGSPYNLEQTECCELVRVALKTHAAPVTQIVSQAIKLLKTTNPGLKLIVSYADPNQGHLGIIYQAGNWIYTGQSEKDYQILFQGKTYHSRVVSSSGYKRQFGKLKAVPKPDQGIKKELLGKHKYLYPLDKKMRKDILPLQLDYPKLN